MAGTLEGGKKAAATNKARHGADFYARIGHRGGSNGHTGGFASEVLGKDGLTGRERASIAGIKGGKKSKRGKVFNACFSDEQIARIKKELAEAWLNGGEEREETNA